VKLKQKMNMSDKKIIVKHNRKLMNKIAAFILTALVICFAALPVKGDSLIDKYVGGLEAGYGTAIYTSAKSNLRQILLCQMAYHKDHGQYINCPPNPKKIPQNEPLPWETGHHYDSWKKLGFELKGKVYYQYLITGAGREKFKAVAKRDEDGDGIYHVISINQDGLITEANTGE
jgi:hypothetical protein